MVKAETGINTKEYYEYNMKEWQKILGNYVEITKQEKKALHELMERQKENAECY